MAKRPRKTAPKKSFAPPPPAVKPDSEFSFGEYEQPKTEADPFGADALADLDFDFNHPDFDGELEPDPFGDFDIYEGAARGLNPIGPHDVRERHYFAERCGTLERLLASDPFTAIYEPLGSGNDYRVGDVIDGKDLHGIALKRFEAVTLAYVNAAIQYRDPLQIRILADLCEYWLRESRHVEGHKIW